MHRQFSRTVDIQTGVVLGDLERVRDAASWLATREEKGSFPEEVDVFQAEIRGYAALMGQDRDLATVATRTGLMAGACGRCHQAVDGGPRFVVGNGPPPGAPGAQAMIDHLWAADRMWEGLVGPSDNAWQAGARALEGAWSRGGAADPEAVPTGSMDRQGIPDRMVSLAREALDATSQEARGEVYGEILSTCTACHGGSGVLARR
jgi:cytochrome c553